MVDWSRGPPELWAGAASSAAGTPMRLERGGERNRTPLRAGTRSVPQSRYDVGSKQTAAPPLGTAAVDLWPRPDSNRRHSA